MRYGYARVSTLGQSLDNQIQSQLIKRNLIKKQVLE